MATSAAISNPYVGPQPFEQKDRDRFFGRDREANELLSLVIANRMALMYAQSGAGKTSLLNARLIPLLREREFDVLPITRVRGLIPNPFALEDVPNPYVLNTLISWATDHEAPDHLALQTIAGYLRQRPHPNDSEGLPAPRVLVFDQFEELFTAYPDRWLDRKAFFDQVVEALDGSPLFLRPDHILEPAEFLAALRQEGDPFSSYVHPHFSEDMQALLANTNAADRPAVQLAEQLAYEFNRLIRRPTLFRNGRHLQGMDLPENLQALVKRQPRGLDRMRLNRLLLEHRYAPYLPPSMSGDPLLRVLFIIREDYIAQLDPYLPDLPNQLRSRFRLMRLKQIAALEAVKKPLKNTPRSFAPGVAENLVQELLKIHVETEHGDVVTIKGEFVEPVQLQVVCENLWRDLPAGVTTITEDQVAKFGDVNEALAAFYESTIAETIGVTGLNEGVLRRFFERTLLTPAGTRGTVYRGASETGGIPNEAIDVLENRHIIRGEWRGGSRWYELTHDRFVEPILESNKRWLERSSSGQQMLRQLEKLAVAWTGRQRAPEALLDEYELIQAESWLQSPAAGAMDIGEDVKALIYESRRAADAAAVAKERKAARRFRLIALGLTVLAIAAVLLWMQALRSREEASQLLTTAQDSLSIARVEMLNALAAQDQANDSLQVARRQQAIAERLLSQSLDSLQIAALRFDAAQNSLTQARLNLDNAIEEREMAEEQAALAFDQRMRADRALGEARIDRDEAVQKLNQAIALTLSDKALRQQRLGNDPLGALLALQAYQFDQRGGGLYRPQIYEALRQTLNAIHADSTVTPGGPDIFYDNDGQVRYVAFSPDGRWLASSGDLNRILLRHLETGRRESIRYADALASGRLTDDRLRHFVDRQARIDPMTRQSIALDDRTARAIAVHPDGTTYATGGADRRIRIWQMGAEEDMLLHELLGHEGPINNLAFSPDGALLASGSSDQSVQLWSTHDYTRNPLVLLGHEFWVWDVAFNPDGSRLASGSGDGTVRVWITRPEELVAKLCEATQGITLTRAQWDTFVGRDFEYDLARLACP